MVERIALIEGIDYTLTPGNELELRIIADIASDQDFRLGYDTKDFPSLVNLSFTPPAPSASFYFHNNPTPPSADTGRQAALPLDAAVPAATTLYRYSVPSNNPGLFILTSSKRSSHEAVSTFRDYATMTFSPTCKEETYNAPSN